MAEYQRIRGREYRRPTLLPEVFGSLPEFARTCPGDRGIARDYVELLKKALLNETNLDLEAAYLKIRSEIGGAGSVRELSDWCAKLEEGRRIGRFVDRTFENMPQCYTLIGRTRMDNLQSCVETVLEQGIPGDLIECGVWKGGACIFIRGILKAYRVRNRKVWVADSFCGVPAPAASDDGLDLSRSMFPQLAISLEQVKSNFEVFSLLDDQVQFLPGWFSDTLPAAPIDRIAVLRLDGDLFSSTMDALTSLYDKVSPGGFIIVDDYGVLPQCARAVHEFRAARQVTTPLETIDWSGVFWRKEP
jgi:O-methyltransferase